MESDAIAVASKMFGDGASDPFGTATGDPNDWGSGGAVGRDMGRDMGRVAGVGVVAWIWHRFSARFFDRAGSPGAVAR
jgi:hypothetical protein